MNFIISMIVAACVGFMVLLFGGFYIVQEGHVGVKTRWGQAISQEAASGIQVKMPIVTGIRQFDVRERRLQAEMAAATANQLPITALITVSWRMDPTRVLEVYKEYGTPEMFEANILQPRVAQAAKAGLAKYQASDLIRDRATATETIMTALRISLEPYPAILASLQIENVILPPRYLEAIMAKEEARESASREQYNLERQALESQKEVQSAEAARDATKATADGEAYRVRAEAQAQAEATILKGDAEASAILAVQTALSNNPLFVEYEKARRWNGQMPVTILGQSPDMMMSIN